MAQQPLHQKAPLRAAGGSAATFLAEQGIDPDAGPDLAAVVGTLQERSATLVEMAAGAEFYFLDQVVYEEKAQAKFLKVANREIFAVLAAELEQCGDFSTDQLEAVFGRVMERMQLKFGKIAQPLRVALTGGTSSPGIYEILEVLGKERTFAAHPPGAGQSGLSC